MPRKTTNQVNLELLLRDATNASQACQSERTGTSTKVDSDSAHRETWNSTCRRFIETSNVFRQRVSALRAAFTQIENVWTAERHDQEAIVKASEDAAR